MFWKLIEFIVRLIFFKRFSAAKKIGKAAQLLGEGKPEEALALLEKVGVRLHSSLLSFWSFTRGKVFVALDRLDEAEKSYGVVVLSDPKNARADLELAILCGRTFRFDESRQWLERLTEKEDEDVKKQAIEVKALLEKTESGEREREFHQRAEAFSQKIETGMTNPLGLPADMAAVERWIGTSPEQAREQFDELALLVGQSLVEQGGKWKVSLVLEASVVVQPDGSEVNPFELVNSKFV